MASPLDHKRCSCDGGSCGSSDIISRRRPLNDDLDEHPSEEDIARFSDVTRTCPECKKDVFDDSAVCYHCGHAFERTTEGTTKAPSWVLVATGLLLGAFVLGALTGIIRIF